MSPTTLPIGIPRLDALVRAQAERMANELQAVCHYPFAVQDPSLAEWEEYVDAIGGLLRDLTRPESRDWAVRVGTDIQHQGNEDDPDAPYYEETRDRWLSMRETPAVLALALAEVCRG